ncbi:N,N-dimethylformamidase beta subunit family domain-containing protein [Streptomyces sp. NPDC050738]|uniref:N,N-dimethylformamidase beta subunit family domain-containing protein n=1 Tax=Streptomyces sp. NPDC050738 TaxID=3154744 RepID=UPI00342261B2
MDRKSRRTALGVFGVSTAALAGYTFRGGKKSEAAAQSPSRPATAFRAPGSRDARKLLNSWGIPQAGTHLTNDRKPGIHGYASATSVARGGAVDFHVSVDRPQKFTVAVHRIGRQQPSGTEPLASSPALDGHRRAIPEAAAGTGLIACDWPSSWRLHIPQAWTSGLYLAVFTAEDGYRGYTPFVVRDTGRRSDILVVVPFTTYQAYNIWPLNGRTGKSLYKGYKSPGNLGGAPERAAKVSFDRPYHHSGIPAWFELDAGFAQWAEGHGYDVTYASSIDLHQGRVDTSRYKAVVFPGHDEYWSKPMVDSIKKSDADGTHLAFFASNNIYFHVRLEASARGTAGRVVACFKKDNDPELDTTGATIRWRKVIDDGSLAEQGVIGTQYNGIVKTPVPLVVRKSDHWIWAGTGLRDGDELPYLVGIEADGYDPLMPSPTGYRRTLLSHSPYIDKRPDQPPNNLQSTCISENKHGVLRFAAGTFFWSLALMDKRLPSEQVGKVTKNLLDRMVKPAQQ